VSPFEACYFVEKEWLAAGLPGMVYLTY